MSRQILVQLLLAAVVLWPARLSAEERDRVDSTLVASLLTCTPGPQPYELYGHTALRLRSEQRGMDVVFNYGVFDFTAPHFIWRFVLGQTDYLLLPESMAQFLDQYARRGSAVYEQELNLSPAECSRLMHALVVESRPENRIYRYNIFRNNCTLRARHAVEACIDGQMVYPLRPRRNTFRSILHQYTARHLWAREGNDLLLGTEVDTLLTERDEMFAPLYMMNYADSAMIQTGRDGYRPLVRQRRMLLEADAARCREAESQLPDPPLSPACAGWLLLAAGLVLAAAEWHRGRICWPADAVLMTLQGLAGLLLTFMALCSEHPGVASNWQVWVLNPLPLLFMPMVVRADIRHRTMPYHRFAALLLALFVVLYPLLPQHFSRLMLPLALLLLSRAVIHLLVYRRRPADNTA